jgi:hypothetical protein
MEESHRRSEDPGLVTAHDLSEGGFVASVETLDEHGILDGFGIHNANIHTLSRAISGYAFLRHLVRVTYKSLSNSGVFFAPKIRAFCGD